MVKVKVVPTVAVVATVNEVLVKLVLDTLAALKVTVPAALPITTLPRVVLIITEPGDAAPEPPPAPPSIALSEKYVRTIFVYQKDKKKRDGN